jgi:hypothetical protein
MPSIINASTTSTSGLVQTADASGVLQLQSNGVTGLTVGTGGLVTAANGIVMSTMTLGAPITGEMEYDGGELYFTPLGTQRGLIPSAQYYRLENAQVGTNASGAQNILGVGVTLSSNTVYHFEYFYTLVKTAGTTLHNLDYIFGGTASINNILWYAHYTNSGVAVTSPPFGTVAHAIGVTNTATTGPSGTQSINTAGITFSNKGFGTVSVGAGGTFIPRYTLSAAPGGAYTTVVGSYFLIYPIGAAGSNISVGTWA